MTNSKYQPVSSEQKAVSKERRKRRTLLVRSVLYTLLTAHGSLLTAAPVCAASLSTSFVDVVVVDVPLGESRRVEDKYGKSLLLTNSSDKTILVRVEALKPDSSELRPPAEPILDPGWVKLNPASLTLGPHETGECEVVLLLPKDRHLRNRIFQTMIWSRTYPANEQGISFNVGLKSRLRFQTMKR